MRGIDLPIVDLVTAKVARGIDLPIVDSETAKMTRSGAVTQDLAKAAKIAEKAVHDDFSSDMVDDMSFELDNSKEQVGDIVSIPEEVPKTDQVLLIYGHYFCCIWSFPNIWHNIDYYGSQDTTSSTQGTPKPLVVEQQESEEQRELWDSIVQLEVEKSKFKEYELEISVVMPLNIVEDDEPRFNFEQPILEGEARINDIEQEELEKSVVGKSQNPANFSGKEHQNKTSEL
ncbi:hypothetical protein GH714_010513 [Hevea brasiliensis]|uniref:Uncharacterized protein n=1 Tax=Hevea brasiliensis TaxID=3981 RepID=A0A6A6MTZ0_HEVBR|nr:hypothetical protein GH714_010513 [Hevea brasiliensis]